MNYIWEIKSTEMGYAIECSNCHHKISVKDAIIANQVIDTCPFCKKDMDLNELDYDKLLEFANGEESDS